MGKLSDFLELRKRQLRIEIDAIRLSIEHRASMGSESESTLRSLLRDNLPKQYSLGGGFVSCDDKISSQFDIIIYDDLMNAPLFKGMNSGVYLVGSVYGIIEVTMGKLSVSKLEKDIAKLGKLRAMIPEEKVKFIKTLSRPHESGKGSVVAQEIVKSSPPPRTYICALSGTSYTSISRLASDVEKFTRKYCAHIHGLLVINDIASRQKDWLIMTRAFEDYKVAYYDQDAFFLFLENMKGNFRGMLVGKLPAAA